MAQRHSEQSDPSISINATINPWFLDMSNYNIVKTISQNDIRSLYLVKNKMTKQAYTIKVHHNIGTSKFNDQSLLQNISSLCLLQAPTLFQLHKFSLQDFESHPALTLLMDYKEGCSLQDLLNKVGLEQSSNQYTNTTKQIHLCGIAHGMTILHSHGVVHGSLSPANIFIDSQSRPYITEYGLSNIFNQSNQNSIRSFNTLKYLAPEILKGSPHNQASDVYSYGILMYEIVSGEKAFGKQLKKKKFNLFEFTNAIKKGLQPEFSDSSKPTFQRLIKRCLSLDPHQRPTFQEIFKQLAFSCELNEDSLDISKHYQIELSNFENGTFDDQECYNSNCCLDNVNIAQLLDYLKEIIQGQSGFDFERKQIQYINGLKKKSGFLKKLI